MQNDGQHPKSDKPSKPGLRYPFAKTSDGERIFIEDAKSKTRYFCWGCQTPMFRRRSKFGIYHFYHKSTTCSFESALHYAFKDTLLKRIERGLIENRVSDEAKTKLMIQWYCLICKKECKGDLLKRISHAKLEVKVDVYKPDISLYRKDGTVYAVIEIEYKHPLDQNPRQYYIINNIGIIEFKPKTVDDLKLLDADPLIPFSCSLCHLQKLVEIESHPPEEKLQIPKMIEGNLVVECETREDNFIESANKRYGCLPDLLSLGLWSIIPLLIGKLLGKDPKDNGKHKPM